MIYVFGVLAMVVLSVMSSDWFKTATDLQVWAVFVAGTWIFAGIVSVHMIHHNLGRRASRFEEENNDTP